MIYEYILNGNKQYGTGKNDICRSAFYCEPEVIREHVIIAPAWKLELFDEVTGDVSLISDAMYKVWDVTVGDEKFTYIVTGIGAPLVIDAVLALGCTPCKKLIFIGSVGALDKNIGIGDIIVPEYSVCGDGACRYLTDKPLTGNDCFGEEYYPDRDLYQTIISKTKAVSGGDNIGWHIGQNFSTDTVLAQFAHLDEIISMGCNCIEMETAALFKSAEICNIKCGAVFSVSDNSVVQKSLLSGRTEDEMKYRGHVRKQYLTKIVLESLFHR